MFERKPRYRHARLKTGRDKTVLRCRVVTASPVPTNKPYPQFLSIVFHDKVSTYFGGHLMHQSTQQQKVPGNSRLRMKLKAALNVGRHYAILPVPLLRRGKASWKPPSLSPKALGSLKNTPATSPRNVFMGLFQSAASDAVPQGISRQFIR